jgi:uncharacterized protein (TIGR00255 family)
MIESMTGYGSGRGRLAGSTIVVNLRSVNNRTFKLSIRMPEALTECQRELEELLREKIQRGTIYCQVEFEGPLAGSAWLDEAAVLDYCNRLRKLAKRAGLRDDMSIERVAALPGAIREDKARGDKPRRLLMDSARKALEALLASRREEGAKIEKEMRKLLGRAVALRDKISGARQKSLREHRKRIAGRINEILADTRVKVSTQEIAREAAILAERSDIAEELQRFAMHTDLMEKTLSGAEPAGRQLEFIAQELLREANTMSAKSVSSKLVAPLLELKASIDKIREQAQNVQ